MTFEDTVMEVAFGGQRGTKDTGSVIEIADVAKNYAGTPPVHALRGVDLTVERGELVGIVGPSGSGKTTLLHIMGTLERPTSGTIRVAGADVGELSDAELSALRARRIGFVFQQFFLLEAVTALDNVADALLYTGMARGQRRDLAAAMLARVGLAARIGHPPSHLSGGERQRVAIARAVLGAPDIVLADEPTGNLDSRSGAEIIELLRELNEEGRTILVITHDRDIASRMPRRVTMRDGDIESDVVSKVAF